MLCDAHVHMGYYSRKGWREPFYYSPRLVFGVLNRCGVDEFIVSSTCAQIAEIGIKDVVREAREMKRLAGRRAHIFFWLSGHLYDEDPSMEWLNSGLFEGIKLHVGETPWVKERANDLWEILSVAAERGLPVMFHAGLNEGSRPKELAEIACNFTSVNFNFAHCRPMDEMAKVIADCPNVWTDTAYIPYEFFPKLLDYDWHGRLMFGTDLPVWLAHENIGVTKRYREYVQAFSTTGLLMVSCAAFRGYLRPFCGSRDE